MTWNVSKGRKTELKPNISLQNLIHNLATYMIDETVIGDNGTIDSRIFDSFIFNS